MAKPRILHVSPDDKFLPFIQTAYEAALPGCSEYRLWGKSERKYAARNEQSLDIPQGYWRSEEGREDVARADILIIHYLERSSIRPIQAVLPSTLVVWCGWGADYTDWIPEYRKHQLLPQTRRVVDELARKNPVVSRRMSRGRRLRHWFQTLFKPDYWVPHRKDIGRIDLFSMLPSDHRKLRQSLPGFRADYHQLHYASVEETYAKGLSEMRGPDIVLGNSAAPTNNHLESLALLRRLSLGDRKIIVPLSYGDPAYADVVVRTGRKYFGERFVPLRDFVPLEEYYRRLQNCGIVWMNHVRQQAIGNVTAGAYKGARVVMNRASPVYELYRELGMHLSAASENMLPPDVLDPLSPVQIAENQQAIRRFWGMDTVIAAIRELQEKWVSRK